MRMMEFRHGACLFRDAGKRVRYLLATIVIAAGGCLAWGASPANSAPLSYTFNPGASFLSGIESCSATCVRTSYSVTGSFDFDSATQTESFVDIEITPLSGGTDFGNIAGRYEQMSNFNAWSFVAYPAGKTIIAQCAAGDCTHYVASPGTRALDLVLLFADVLDIGSDTFTDVAFNIVDPNYGAPQLYTTADNETGSVNSVPEPSPLAFMSGGVFLYWLSVIRRRSRKTA